jgi:beta-glucanase (GH16 family)
MKIPRYPAAPGARIGRIFSKLAIGALVLYGVLGGGALVTQGQSLSLVWSDEFNGASIDMTKWTFDIGNGGESGNPGWGNDELEYYTSNSANVYVTNGFLHIHAQSQVTNTPEGTFNYTSARMKTQGLFWKTYGRIEWRAALPGGVGFWPAIWMLGTNDNSIGWPGCGEIDVVENNGAAITVEQGSIHSGTDASQTYDFPTGETVTNFHVYDLDWNTNSSGGVSITWSVDGIAYETQTDWGSSTSMPYPFPFNQPFFFLMNLAVGGDYLGNPTPNEINPSMPGEVVIDYIRVYNYTPTVSIGVQANPSIGGTVSGGGVYSTGTNVTVCAMANACYSFVNWTTRTATSSAPRPATLCTAATNETLVANFTPIISCTITTSSSPGGGGSTSGGGTVACGSNVTVCATPDAMLQLSELDAERQRGQHSACYTFESPNSETLVANFTPPLCTRSAPAVHQAAMAVPPAAAGRYAVWLERDGVRDANPCYSFVNWTDQNSNVVSASACYSFTRGGQRDLGGQLRADHLHGQHQFVTAGRRLASGGGTYTCGSNVTVCATTNAVLQLPKLDGQNSNAVSTSACYTFTATSNEVVVANLPCTGSVRVAALRTCTISEAPMGVIHTPGWCRPATAITMGQPRRAGPTAMGRCFESLPPAA